MVTLCTRPPTREGWKPGNRRKGKEHTMRRTLELLKIIVLLPVTALALIAYACNIDPDEAAGWRH